MCFTNVRTPTCVSIETHDLGDLYKSRSSSLPLLLAVATFARIVGIIVSTLPCVFRLVVATFATQEDS